MGVRDYVLVHCQEVSPPARTRIAVEDHADVLRVQATFPEQCWLERRLHTKGYVEQRRMLVRLRV
jgi:hypothetical protein